MSLVEEDTVDDSFDGLIDRGIVEDDVGGFPAQFQREFLVRRRKCFLNELANFGRAGEGDFVKARMFDDRRASLAATRENVHDAGRKIRIRNDLGELESRQRRRLGRLEDYGIPTSK